MNVKRTLKKIKRHSPISIGMRTLKTSLSATLTALIALTPVIGNPFYALMGAVFSMQTTVSNSFKMGKGRVIGTAIGAFIGFVFAYFQWDSPLFIGFAIALVIVTCGLLKITHSILITITLCLLIMFNPNREGGLFNYAFFRTLDTALGVVIGFLINRFVAPPNHLKALVSELENIYKLTERSLKAKSGTQLPKLKRELAHLMVIHTNYQADEKYDHHDVSKESLRVTLEACSGLYFHFQHYQAENRAVAGYHLAQIEHTLNLLQQKINELKGVV